MVFQENPVKHFIVAPTLLPRPSGGNFSRAGGNFSGPKAPVPGGNFGGPKARRKTRPECAKCARQGAGSLGAPEV